MTDRTVKVKLTADTADYKRGMADASRATDKIALANQKAQKQADKWRTIGRATTIAGAAVAVGMLAATKAASDQEQAMGSLSAVFKTNTAVMAKNAEGATKIGLSQTKYAESAAQLGAQLGNLGIDQVDLAKTTDDLITVAADMAAQFGGTTSDAVASLSSLMRGERDPIEKFGITINEAGLKAEMASTGFSKTEATLSLLNKQLESSGTLGAAAREFDTTAAATMRMKAEAENAAAAFGEALLPAMAAAAGGAAKMLGAFNDLPGPMKSAITYVVGLSTAALVVGPRLVQMKLAMDASTVSGVALAGAMGKLSTVLGVLGKGAVIGAVALGIYKLADALSEMELGSVTSDMSSLEQQLIKFAQGGSELGRFGNELDSVGESFEAAGGLASQFFSRFGINGGGADIRETSAEIDAIDAAMTGLVNSGNADVAADAFERFVRETEAVGGNIDQVRDSLPQYATALETVAEATENGTAADDDAIRAKAELAAKVDALVANLMSLVQINLAMIGSQDALIGQEGRLSEAFGASGRALQGRNKAAAANRAAMSSEIGLISALADATYKRVAAVEGEPAALEASNAVMSKHIGKLRENAISAGMSEKAVDKFIASVLKVPGAKDTKISAPGADDSKKKIDKHNDAAKVVPLSKSTKITAPGAIESAGQINRHSDAARVVPLTASTTVSAPGATTAASQLYGVAAAVRAIDSYKLITIHTVKTGATAGSGSGGGGGGSWATGGRIRGQGTTTSDSILARVSNDEFVMQAAATSKYGFGYMDALNAGRIDPKDLPRFAKGGRARRREQRRNNKWFRSMIRGRPWADEKWRDYNPTPRAKIRPSSGKKVKSWASELAQDKKSWRSTVRRENLDWKWSRRDRLAADRGGAADRVRGSASLSGFDVRGAQSDQDAFRSAVGAVGSAGSPEARAKAVQVAREAGIKAMQSAVTPANVTKWMAQKLKTLVDFSTVLGQLRAKGLHPVTLAEVAGMSPEDGLAMGRALMGADLSKINALQSHINRTSAAFGVQQTAREARSASSLAWYGNKAASGTAGSTVAEVNVYLDSEQIATGQQRLDQRLGIAA